ncbi:MAG TPA: hypothetical protein VGS19_23760 [Streptosporangiaceae bacterium]|nr:hypothetical protein [Streptosporangiaceae bacterium]
MNKRKEEARREARVERWDEPAGTTALAGRDLLPAEVLATDRNLTDLARELKAAGMPGTMDQLRAAVFLALLSGRPLGSLLTAATDGQEAASQPQASPAGRGSVNLTMVTGCSYGGYHEDTDQDGDGKGSAGGRAGSTRACGVAHGGS